MKLVHNHINSCVLCDMLVVLSSVLIPGGDYSKKIKLNSFGWLSTHHNNSKSCK